MGTIEDPTINMLLKIRVAHGLPPLKHVGVLVLLLLLFLCLLLLLVVGCWLLVVGCWLLVVVCCLLVVGCWLLVVGCWLLVVGCWLLVVGCWLLVVGCLLFVVCCLLFVVCCLVVWLFGCLVVVVVVRLDLYKEFDVLRNLASMFLLNQSYFNSYSENHQTRWQTCWKRWKTWKHKLKKTKFDTIQYQPSTLIKIQR